MKVNGDGRIKGDGDFVEAFLKEADEQLERRCHLTIREVDLDQIVGRVAAGMPISIERIGERNGPPQVLKVRSLLCFWANKELKVSMTELSTWI